MSSPKRTSINKGRITPPPGAQRSPTTPKSPAKSQKANRLGSPAAFLNSKRPQSAMASYPVLRNKGVNGTSNGRFSSEPRYDIYSDQLDGSGGANVKVVVRVRPFLPRETQKDCINLISMSGSSTTINPPPANSSQTTATRTASRRNAEPKTFTFDHSLWSCSSDDVHFADQEKVYECVGKEFLNHNLEGYHTCIFAYGQTGSGKSHTMMGSDSDPGLIPRTCTDLFDRIERMTSGNVTCTVRVSYFEVYNEQVRDLLAKPESITNGKGSLHKLKVRESPTEGPYVEDLSEFSVKSADDVLKYLSSGNKARSVAATKMNDVSSRSHAVFTLVVKQVITDPFTDATEEKTARIRLVDLAGSERATSTGATGQRLREGSNINKSLTTLGRVIAALADNSNDISSASGRSSPSKKSTGDTVIPYRDSVLTWILKDSLGGNSKTAMVACISPTDYDETLSTLRYADQAKSIKTRAVVNQDIVSAADRDKLLAEMQERINSLQSSLLQQQQQDTNQEDLEKVRSAIRFYEDRAIAEENKRRAIQLENVSIRRHNKLLTEHLKEVTNQSVGNLQVVKRESPNAQSEKESSSYAVVPIVSYEDLNLEMQGILKDIHNFKSSLQSDITKFNELKIS